MTDAELAEEKRLAHEKGSALVLQRINANDGGAGAVSPAVEIGRAHV